MRATSSLVSCLAAILATVAVSQAQERHTHPLWSRRVPTWNGGVCQLRR